MVFLVSSLVVVFAPWRGGLRSAILSWDDDGDDDDSGHRTCCAVISFSCNAHSILNSCSGAPLSAQKDYKWRSEFVWTK